MEITTEALTVLCDQTNDPRRLLKLVTEHIRITNSSNVCGNKVYEKLINLLITGDYSALPTLDDFQIPAIVQELEKLTGETCYLDSLFDLDVLNETISVYYYIDEPNKGMPFQYTFNYIDRKLLKNIK